MPRNVRFIDRDDIKEVDYDLVVLPFDENVLHYELCNDAIVEDWGLTFQWVLKNIDLPKVAMCHGTPQFFGQYDARYQRDNLGHVIESSRQELVNLLDDVIVICNSHQSQHEWRFRKSRVITHGFSPSDWPPGSHERWLLAMRRDSLKNRPHYNGLFVNDSIIEKIRDVVPFDHLEVPDPPAAYQPNTQPWAVSRFQNYVREIGRYKVYFNPTIRSPMPRARGEAMMAGLATVSLRNHDVDLFVRNGVNGFFGDTPEELAEQILYLYRNPRACERMQQASRRTALDMFNLDRYLAEWRQVFRECAG
jgi:glycosyltransferase involved in cell wall biosynthesis